MFENLSQKAAALYDYIRDCNLNGFSPSVRELATKLHLKSISSIYNYLNELENNGLITREQNQNRSIRITNNKSTVIPVIGEVTAGMPIFTNENIIDYIPISTNIDKSNLFALNVMGDSMKNAGILDGDTIVVKKTPTANNNDIVVALIDECATVKRFFKTKDSFVLRPENPDFEDIICDELSILGVVIMLFRKF